MSIRRSRWAISWLFLPLCSGCLPAPRDISDRADVRALGLVGRCLMLKDDTPLIEVGRPYRRLVVTQPPIKAQGGPGRRVGTLPAGTRVRVVRVEHAVYYWDGMFSIEGELAFGRLESGEHLGKVVDLGWWGQVLPGADDDLRRYVPCP